MTQVYTAVKTSFLINPWDMWQASWVKYTRFICASCIVRELHKHLWYGWFCKLWQLFSLQLH